MHKFFAKLLNKLVGPGVEASGESIQSCAPAFTNGGGSLAHMEEGQEPQLPDPRLAYSEQVLETNEAAGWVQHLRSIELDDLSVPTAKKATQILDVDRINAQPRFSRNDLIDGPVARRAWGKVYRGGEARWRNEAPIDTQRTLHAEYCGQGPPTVERGHGKGQGGDFTQVESIGGVHSSGEPQSYDKASSEYVSEFELSRTRYRFDSPDQPVHLDDLLDGNKGGDFAGTAFADGNVPGTTFNGSDGGMHGGSSGRTNNQELTGVSRPIQTVPQSPHRANVHEGRHPGLRLSTVQFEQQTNNFNRGLKIPTAETPRKNACATSRHAPTDTDQQAYRSTFKAGPVPANPSSTVAPNGARKMYEGDRDMMRGDLHLNVENPVCGHPIQPHPCHGEDPPYAESEGKIAVHVSRESEEGDVERWEMSSVRNTERPVRNAEYETSRNAATQTNVGTSQAFHSDGKHETPEDVGASTSTPERTPTHSGSGELNALLSLDHPPLISPPPARLPPMRGRRVLNMRPSGTGITEMTPTPPNAPLGRKKRPYGRKVVENVNYFDPMTPGPLDNAGTQDKMLSSDLLRPSALHTEHCNGQWEWLSHVYEPRYDWDEGSPYGELDSAKIVCGPQIGGGATSEVHKGVYYKDERTPVDVVLKFLKHTKGHNVRKEFRRESQILVQLPPHKNVVKMIGVVGACMVLEHCNKGNLYSVLHDPRCYISWAKAWDIATGVAEGMHHLHQNRIIHRDLKPGNLMVHEVDGADVMKIADFGLSRNFLRNTPMTIGVGTWQYSAPEVLLDENYSHKADVYSYGMVLWEVSTRSEPFRGVGSAKAYKLITEGHPPLPPKSAPRGFRDLINMCLSLEPCSRPSFKDIMSRLFVLKNEFQRMRQREIILPDGEEMQH